jgi:cytochrome d ubiquinol oxidase subunit I
MGLALLMVVLKTMALRTGNEHYNRAARFWARIFAINFAMGVVTGIPMEFQFGTNWARFSKSAGGVIGQTLAMEGVFSFFLESSFLGLFLFGEKKLGPKATGWRAFWFSWDRGCPDSSSWPPTPGCSIRWATRWGRAARFCSRAFGDCC